MKEPEITLSINVFGSGDYVLYKITSKHPKATGWAYFGTTSQFWGDRFEQHLKASMRGSNARLHAAMRELGRDTVDIEPIDVFRDTKSLLAAERSAISQHTGFLWNASKGGERVDPDRAYAGRYKKLAQRFHKGDRVRVNRNTHEECSRYNGRIPDDVISFDEGVIVRSDYEPENPRETVLYAVDRRVRRGREIRMRKVGFIYALNPYTLRGVEIKTLPRGGAGSENTK